MSSPTEQPPEVASKTGSLRRTVAFLAVILVPGSLFGWVLFNAVSHREEKTAPDPVVENKAPDFRLPPVHSSRFRNTAASVAYVGNRACRECHPGEHATYLETNHSRSLAEIDASHEPPSAEFQHELSGRHYRVYRDGKTLRQCEFVRDSDGQEVVLADHAMRYVLGSGNFARMYLVDIDDSLLESPMTWYPRRNKWGMSAGYEKDPLHPGFSRSIGWSCLNCHAGRARTIDGADQRLKITEHAISCERCHGPGELHVRERKAGLPIHGGIDDSIVNLRHLSRARQEDVCSQCHFSSAADVSVRGRSVMDFRPGLRMSDFRVSYRIKRDESGMTVSGQIEQMRLSRCYIESKSMTCATCHDPHAVPKKSERVAYFRNKCLSCHQTESCGLPVKQRRAKQPQDNCAACHMPRGPTDIPHFSFAHHRIGIHKTSKTEKYNASDRLEPAVDVSHLPEHERMRQLGLANDHFAGKLAGGFDDETRDDPSYRALADVFRRRAREILEQVRAAGVEDPALETALSRHHWRRNPRQCILHAEAALKSSAIAPSDRRDALFYLSSTLFDARRYKEATPHLQAWAKIERFEIPLMLLAICHQRQGRPRKALPLIRQAVLIAPFRADLHETLATAYRELQHPDEAKRHSERAKLLRRLVPQPEKRR